MNIFLKVIIFWCGAVVMILELAASRVIAPYLGTSTIIWTSVIGIILGSLSFGYWWGGRVADRGTSRRGFGAILFIAGVLIGFIVFFRQFLYLVSHFETLGAGAIFATVALFAPATIVLGMVTPYAARLHITQVETSGRTIGNLYALSTVGSILGTFLGGFFLIAYFGTTHIITFLSGSLIVLGGALYLMAGGSKGIVVGSIVVLLSLGFLPQVPLMSGVNMIADIDTNYGRYFVFDTVDVKTKKPIRYLASIPQVLQSGEFIDEPNTLLTEYLKFFRIAENLRPGFKESLMIGAGAYSYPKYYVHAYPDKRMDVVEIDPELASIAKRYFSYEGSDRISTIHEDGRTFLNRNTKKYPVIFIDAFLSYWSPPYQLTTREAVERIAASVDDDGVVMVNIISGLTGGRSDFFRAEYATYQEAFSYITILKVHPEVPDSLPQNLVMIASKRSHEESLPADVEVWRGRVATDLPVLTDDYSPVEWYASKFFF